MLDDRYAVTLAWEQINSESLENTLPDWLRDLLFIFAVTNSVFNPFVHSPKIFIRLMSSVTGKVIGRAVNAADNVSVGRGASRTDNHSVSFTNDAVQESHV